MAQNDYRPVSWNGEPISNAKLNQMANNTQFIFERMPKMRYSNGGVIRDTSLKMIAGKTPYVPSATGADWTEAQVLFGTYFTVGCKPIVTAVVADSVSGRRRRLDVRALSGAGSEIDHNGFICHIVQALQPGNTAPQLLSSGWVHWHAVGY